LGTGRRVLADDLPRGKRVVLHKGHLSHDEPGTGNGRLGVGLR
jgi:hypothetical protein